MDIAQSHAYDRIQQFGFRGVTALELLTVVLTREEADVESNQPVIQQRFKHLKLSMFSEISFEDMHASTGLERYEAARLLAALELGRRAGIASQGEERSPVTRQEEAFEIFSHLSNFQQEHFCAAYFDSKAKLIALKTVHIGTLNSSVVGAREVFREAVRQNAASVIVAHNHPSGDPEPSPEDVKVTHVLKEAGRLLDVPLLDHIVIGHNRKFVSLNARGVL